MQHSFLQLKNRSTKYDKRSLGPCSDSSATPSFPSQPEGKVGLPRANPRGRLTDEIAPGTWFQLTDDEMERLSKTDTKFETCSKLVSIGEDGVITEDVKTGKKRFIPAQYLILSLGVRPTGRLARDLDELSVRRIWRVGDAVKSGTIADACHSAFDAVMSIR